VRATDSEQMPSSIRRVFSQVSTHPLEPCSWRCFQSWPGPRKGRDKPYAAQHIQRQSINQQGSNEVTQTKKRRSLRQEQTQELGPNQTIELSSIQSHGLDVRSGGSRTKCSCPGNRNGVEDIDHQKRSFHTSERWEHRL
jgi:hypothetical protein